MVRRRAIVLAISLVVLGPLVAFVLATGPVRLARVSATIARVELGRSRDLPRDLERAARLAPGTGVVARLLARHLDHPENAVRTAALRALARHFPETPQARAVREFEELSGEPYFWDRQHNWKWTDARDRARGARADLPLAVAIERWRSFCDRWTDFPGRDDAALRLARCLAAAERRGEALVLLSHAWQWGDRDAAHLMARRRAQLLDVEPEDRTETEERLARVLLASSSASLALRGRYARAMSHAYARRFSSAACELERFLAEARATDEAPLVESDRYLDYDPWDRGDRPRPTRRELFLADVAAQWATFERLARLEDEDDATLERAVAKERFARRDLASR